MWRRVYINFLAFFLGFFFVVAAGAAFAQSCGADWISGPGAVICVQYTGGCVLSTLGTVDNVTTSTSIALFSCDNGPNTGPKPPGTYTGPAANTDGSGCNAGKGASYTVSGGSIADEPGYVNIGGCQFSTSSGIVDSGGTHIVGTAVSTGAAAALTDASSGGGGIAPSASAGGTGSAGGGTAAPVAPTGAKVTQNADGSTTSVTVGNIGDGSGGIAQTVTTCTTPAGGGTAVCSSALATGIGVATGVGQGTGVVGSGSGGASSWHGDGDGDRNRDHVCCPTGRDLPQQSDLVHL